MDKMKDTMFYIFYHNGTLYTPPFPLKALLGYFQNLIIFYTESTWPCALHIAWKGEKLPDLFKLILYGYFYSILK